jgi:signal transduction histidine kinase
MYVPVGRVPAGPGALLVALPLGFRRRWPIPVFLVVMAAAIAGGSQAGGPGAGYVPIACIMVAAYSVGAFSSSRVAALGVLLGAAIVVVAMRGQLPNIPAPAAPFVVLFPLWLIGTVLRAKQQRAEGLEIRAERLEDEREAALNAAVAGERSRIARELHDVVAHSVSVMIVQAGAARQVLEASPSDAREALLAVESTGREAMSELRKMLGLLGDGELQPADLAPQPGLDQIEPLVRRVEQAGLPVELRVTGEPHSLPQGVDLAAYRIVQEALTNCLKYAGLAATQVNLDYRPDELKVEVIDQGEAQPSSSAEAVGRGLVGMRERVSVYGGKLEAGPCLERGYAVRAWLPLTAAPPCTST